MISEHSALVELLTLKTMKDNIDFLRSQPYHKVEADRLEAEYLNRTPLAWENARLALRLSQVDWSISG